MIRELLDKVRRKASSYEHDDEHVETEAEHYAHASVGRDRMATLYAESPEAHALQLAAAAVRAYQEVGSDDYQAMAKALAPDALWCFIGRKSQALWEESTEQALRYVRCNCDACKTRQRYRQRGVS